MIQNFKWPKNPRDLYSSKIIYNFFKFNSHKKYQASNILVDNKKIQNKGRYDIMSISKLKIMYNHNTRKYLRQASEDWKRNVIKNSGHTCFITGKKQKNGNGVILTAHHVGRTWNSIVREAHKNLKIQYHDLTTDYGSGELTALLEEIARLHRGIEGICLTKEVHDKLHRDYGKNATMDDVREMKRNYRRMNHQNRNGVYKSKRSA